MNASVPKVTGQTFVAISRVPATQTPPLFQAAQGSFLRSFTWGNVRQLESAGQEFLSGWPWPPLPGKDVLTFTGIDSRQERDHAATTVLTIGVRAGDLLVAAEASARTIVVRGASSCTVRYIAAGPAITHAEGHITFTQPGS